MLCYAMSYSVDVYFGMHMSCYVNVNIYHVVSMLIDACMHSCIYYALWMSVVSGVYYTLWMELYIFIEHNICLINVHWHCTILACMHQIAFHDYDNICIHNIHLHNMIYHVVSICIDACIHFVCAYMLFLS